MTANPYWQIIRRDGDDTRLAQLTDWTSLDLDLALNDVSTWTLRAPYSDPLVDWAPSGRIEIRYQTFVLTGFVEDFDGDEPGDQMTIVGYSDNALLADRLCYPDPANAPASWAAAGDSYDTQASTLLRSLANVNIGPGALAARRSVTLAADPADGATIPKDLRLENLLDVYRLVATEQGLAFDVVDGELTIWTPVTRPEVVFSKAEETATGIRIRDRAPQVTTVIVGGAGDGASRAFVEVTDTAAEARYGRRREGFLDARNATTTAELTQAGAEFLAAQQATPTYIVSAVDAPRQPWPTAWAVGDHVRAVIRGELVTTQITGARVAVTGDTTVTPILGPIDGTRLDSAVQRRRLDIRTRTLEGGK